MQYFWEENKINVGKICFFKKERTKNKNYWIIIRVINILERKGRKKKSPAAF